MRLWSLHPKYLDTKGLTALWRETLLAKKVLEGRTIGYKHHPQLIRFRNSKNSIDAINKYLFEVFLEAERRNYKFDKKKISTTIIPVQISVTEGQLSYEFKHLLQKLKERNPVKYLEIKSIKNIEPNPVFNIVSGKIETWELVK